MRNDAIIKDLNDIIKFSSSSNEATYNNNTNNTNNTNNINNNNTGYYNY